MDEIVKNDFLGKVIGLLNKARTEIVSNANRTTGYTYYELGAMFDARFCRPKIFVSLLYDTDRLK